MKDQQIFRIALLTSILGITGMIFFAGEITAQEIKIKDLNKGMVGRAVAIEGVVDTVDKSPRSSTYFMTIMDGTGKTTAVIFESTEIELEKGNLTVNSFAKHKVRITGKVEEYNGNMEIILNDAKSVKILI